MMWKHGHCHKEIQIDWAPSIIFVASVTLSITLGIYTIPPAAAESVKIEDDSLTCVPSTTDTLDYYNSGPPTIDTLDNGHCANCEVVGTSESRHGCTCSSFNYIGELPNAPASAEPGRSTLDVHSNNNFRNISRAKLQPNAYGLAKFPRGQFWVQFWSLW